MKHFTTVGIVNNSFLQFLKQNDIETIRNNQVEGSILKDASQVGDEILLTLIAVSLFNTQYAKERKLWVMIERKAKKACI